MKHLIKALFISLPILLSSCGGDDSANKEIKDPVKKVEKVADTPTEIPWTDDYGIGPIAKGGVTLGDVIDDSMAEQGKEIYSKMCTACHKPEKKFIGPAPKGVLKIRTPEWVMNMILNPEQMIKENAAARKLLMEFNGAPMANQNLTEDQARQVLEYFRTL